MIAFLTLCYIAVLAVLVRFKVIRLNLWWKLSPLAWMLFLIVVLFIPMQWGAPAGSATVYRYVVEIVPNVSGEVVEVPAEGLEPMKKGQVLFKIDPVPYQAEVDRLEAELAEAKQNVERLEATAEAAAATVKKTEEEVEVLKSEQAAAGDSATAAEAAVEEAKANRDAATTEVADRKVHLAYSQRRVERVRTLVPRGAATADDLDTAMAELTKTEGQLNRAEAGARAAEAALARAEADRDAAQSNADTVDLRLKQLIEAELPQVRAQLREARLAADSTIGDVHTSVARIEARLESASYDLEQTVVRAPADGYVIGATLRPGQRVTNLPMRSWMAYMNDEETRVVVGIPQYALRHVKPGQRAEVALKLYPGKTFGATVDSIAFATPGGQLEPSGAVPQAPTGGQPPDAFGVVLELDEAGPDLRTMPGGAAGMAAIYTDAVVATHPIRRVMIRMQSFMNYVIPC
jgi:multidrug resistance efflux pump